MHIDSDDEIPTLIEHPTTTRTAARVPLTIICGFLGAGKSTLLKRILTERHGYRIAVIMNEFGDTADIESKAVNVSSPDDPADSEEILELANGCLCCSIKDSGAAAIEKLMQRKGAFDHILLETTGLADPGPIASIFWHNEEFAAGLGRDIVLDGVVCVVDAFFGTQQMEEDHSDSEDHIGESLKQIAGSDVVLLNKVDLVSPETLATVESLIRRVNPAAPIHRTVRGDVDLAHIMGIKAFSAPPPSLPPVPVPVSAPTPHNHEHGDDCDHADERDPNHYELRGISSLQVSCPVLSPARFDALDAWIRSVLWENRIPDPSPAEGEGEAELLVLRCKGLIAMETGERYVLQGVRSMYDMIQVDNDTEERKGQEEDIDIDIGVSQVGKIVLIGKGLGEDVRRSLTNAISGV